MRDGLYGDKYYKTFWFIKVVKDNKPMAYYGTQKRILNISQNRSDIAWYIKEYGYKTRQAALRGMSGIMKWYKDSGVNFDWLDVEGCQLEFSKDDAILLRYITAND